MQNKWPTAKLQNVMNYRKDFITIDDSATYRRVTAKLQAKGVVLRDEIEGSQLKTKKQQICRKGDFLVAEIDAKVGGFGIVPDELEGAIVSSHYFLFEINGERLDRKYLHYYVKTPDFQKQIRARGSTNYAAIRPEQVLNLEVPLPSLQEQRFIVIKVQDLIKRIDELRKFRYEAMSESEILFGQASGAVFESINHIKKENLAAVATKIGSGSTPKGGRSSYPSSGIPFIRSMNVRMRKFQWDGIVFISRATHNAMNGTQVRPNDVLLNITGASLGRVACAPPDLSEANVNQHVSILRPTEALNPRFLMYWLSQPSVQILMSEKQKGETREGLTKAQIEAFEVPVPSLQEQRRIVAYLDSLQEKLDQLQGLQNETEKDVAELVPSILDTAFAGEL